MDLQEKLTDLIDGLMAMKKVSGGRLVKGSKEAKEFGQRIKEAREAKRQQNAPKIEEEKKNLSEVSQAISKGKTYRDDMLKRKHTNIDQELSLLNPDKTKDEIKEIEREKSGYLTKKDSVCENCGSTEMRKVS